MLEFINIINTILNHVIFIIEKFTSIGYSFFLLFGYCIYIKLLIMSKPFCSLILCAVIIQFAVPIY